MILNMPVLSDSRISEIVARHCAADEYRNRRVLVIIPDGTRTAPIGVMFDTLYRQIGVAAKAFDVLIALGTHQPMSDAAICRRLEITPEQRASTYGRVKFFNHAWNDPAALRQIGLFSPAEVAELTDNRFEMEVPVEINRMLFDYDKVILVGPVFPHEVVGFSGGNKYLFPGVSGPQILNFFHWLGAVVTNPKIIGQKWTPVRKVIDRAGAMVKLDKLCFCLVAAPDGTLAGLFGGSPESAWDQATDLSRELHVTYKDRPFRKILSCAPPMYDELWTAGKCMYKLEPVLADGGELIIFAPHIKEICVSHGRQIEQIGYHCRDYFLRQWDQFKQIPWGVLAHSSHVRGIGTFENGVEKCRAQVTLASQIPEATCRRINLGYLDPDTVDPAQYAGREAESILLVPKGGEMLFQLTHPPHWCG
jgi:nickel-dependent lactate racemase